MIPLQLCMSQHAVLPAVVHQVWRDDRTVDVLPVERVQQGGRTVDTARELHSRGGEGRGGERRGEEGEGERSGEGEGRERRGGEGQSLHKSYNLFSLTISMLDDVIRILLSNSKL